MKTNFWNACTVETCWQRRLDDSKRWSTLSSCRASEETRSGNVLRHIKSVSVSDTNIGLPFQDSLYTLSHPKAIIKSNYHFLSNCNKSTNLRQTKILLIFFDLTLQPRSHSIISPSPIEEYVGNGVPLSTNNSRDYWSQESFSWKLSMHVIYLYFVDGQQNNTSKDESHALPWLSWCLLVERFPGLGILKELRDRAWTRERNVGKQPCWWDMRMCGKV